MNAKRIVDIVSVLVGTIVGAGFATGNEIYTFFARFGYFSYVLVLIFFVGMFAFTYKIMNLAHKYNAYSIDELSKKVFGEKFSFIVNVVIYLAFFVFASVMISAMNNISSCFSSLIMIVLAFILCVNDKRGILTANQIISPAIWLFLVLLLIKGYSFESATTNLGYFSLLGVFGVFYYIALNELISFGSLLVVLNGATKKELLTSAILGSFILSIMIIVVILILNNYTFFEIVMPLKDVAILIGGYYPVLINLILFCTIFTTFLSSVFGLFKRIETIGKKTKLIFASVLLTCYLLSFVGFNSLIQYAYSIVGFISLGVSLCFLFVKSK